MIGENDKLIIRELAKKVRDIAELPEMEERKNRWYNHNALKPDRPMVLCFPEGAWSEIISAKQLECENDILRDWEMKLKQQIYWWEYIRDDNVLEPWFNINWSVHSGDYGVEIPITQGNNRGSYVWEPPIKDIKKDMNKLKFRQPFVNREKTMTKIQMAQEIFGDVLPVRLRGNFWWTMGLTGEVIRLIGLENLMIYMYDEPENLHSLMAWLRDEHLHFIKWFQDEGLLSLDNENDYTGSGGVAYTKELPQDDWDKSQPARLQDLWGFAESQETVGISPAMFAEFVLPYQMPIPQKFGLNCYGCCEPIHERWEYLKDIPNLRRLSVSPWCNQEVMADVLGKQYIFSRKPNPSLVCTMFHEDEIRKDLRQTISVARKGVLEIILKDTHTVQNDPSRLSRWVEIALEEVQK